MNLPDKYRGNDLIVQGAPGLPTTPVQSGAADRLDLRFLISIFRRRFRLFVAIVSVCLLTAFLLTLKQPNRYQAVADVVMNAKQGEIVPNNTAAQVDAPLRSEQIDTELKVIQSQGMAGQVVSSLKLTDDKEFVTAVLGQNSIFSSLRRLVGLAPPPPKAADVSRSLSDALLADLKATRLETAYAIRISFTSTDPVRAAAIANGFARTYAGSAVQTKASENEKTTALLKSRIDELRAQAQQDFGAVQDFRVRNDLLSAEATALAEQDASAYGQQLAAARAAAAGDRGRANTAGGAATQATLTSPVIQSLRSQRAALSIRVADLSGRYLDGHPDLADAKRQLADIDNQISAETGRVMSGTAIGISSTAQASAQQVGSIQSNLAAARAKLAQNNRALVGLDDLSRKAQASQSLYESYLSRYKEILAQSGTERPDARLISAAKVPSIPVSPSMLLNLALGLLIGGLLGAGSAIAAESAFSGLTTGDEVEGRLGVRYLGGIPLLSSIDAKGSSPESSLDESPGSSFAESIRGLLTSVRQNNGGRNQVLAVTSALPGEGKSSLSLCMARSAARAGETVIVIDCDLVRSKLSAFVGADRSRAGLREMMRGEIKLGDAMIKDPVSDAMVLPITAAFEGGERLLEKGNFHKMIALLREHFSLIILDTAPILPVAETREIVTLADNVIVTALWRKTSDSAIRSALKLLPHHAIGDIGIVLNRIDMKKQVKFGAGDASYYYDSYKEYYAKS